MDGSGVPTSPISMSPTGELSINGFLGIDQAKVSVTNGTVHATLTQVGFTSSLVTTKSVPVASVKKIIFHGGNGADSFSNDTAIPSEAFGGLGPDTLIGGSSADVLHGEDGNDHLEGRGGSDQLMGGTGGDTYRFAGAGLGADSVSEPDYDGADTLDFSKFQSAGFLGLPLPVKVDLSITTPQVINPGNLTLTLLQDAVVNVVGSFANDVIKGNLFANSIHGMGGNDTIDGRAGNDTLYGDGGADQINGGPDNDLLLGGPQNDVLHGNAGDDELRGGADDDLLRGDNGTDQLFGNAGNDGLFGGGLADTLTGGLGADRFLQTVVQSLDTLTDVSADDATVSFVNTPFDSTVSGYRWTAGTWSDSEIEWIDQALAGIESRTGNTKLLKTSGGGSMTFKRWGTPYQPQFGNLITELPNWLAFNNDQGTIHIRSTSFDRGKPFFLQIVQHEMGHNWDNENPQWSQFKSLSDWKTPVELLFSNPPSYVASADGNWYYAASAASHFANEYGKTNPYEDFATSFEAYFAAFEQRSFLDSANNAIPGAAQIPNKIAFLDAFFATMS